MAEATIEAFVLFCEDLRHESGGKQSLLGVLGGSLFIPEGTTVVETLKAVLIARIQGTRSVEITVSVRAHIDGKTLGPDEDYSATFSQDSHDKADKWTLQLAADLAGLKLGKENAIVTSCKINDVVATASLPLIFGDGISIRDSQIENEVGGQAEPLPIASRKSRKKSRAN
ncbi:hypothetical protein [Sphingomonas sp. Leaf357]|uniref:hypothetical protein n=1 Tax=Sphingomonas sp. Leaf357 TaxID=1736350 RepID=UPI0012E0EF6A|nr:hypothetical protein [Sphingomonas sp. Leaf357]